MKGVTKGIIERYEYGSKADELKKEYNELYQKYRRLNRAYILETDKKRRNILKKQLDVYNKQLNAMKVKIKQILEK